MLTSNIKVALVVLVAVFFLSVETRGNRNSEEWIKNTRRTNSKERYSTPVTHSETKDKPEQNLANSCPCMEVDTNKASVWRDDPCYIFFTIGQNCDNKKDAFQFSNQEIKDLDAIIKLYPDLKNGRVATSSCNTGVNCTSLQHLLSAYPLNTGNKQSQPPSTWEIALLGVVGSLALVMVIVVIVMSILLWRKKRRIREIRQRCLANHRAQNIHQIDAIEVNDYVNDVTGLGVLCATFVDGYEIPRSQINIGNIRDSSASIIGVGEFSIVFKGRLETRGRDVAVKAMKSGQATPRTMKWTLRECQIFKNLENNPAILEFLGVCTENVRNGELFVVMELCERGSLKGFLAQHRSHFISLVEDGEWINDSRMYEESVLQSGTCIEVGSPIKFNTIQLFKWCVEIANVMEFLAARKIVHVSLSARNVLLNDRFSTKLSDFHFAKVPGDSVHPSGTFSTINLTNVNKERIIPWRHFAIESLLDDTFTTQSDVWSFGVFLWEVFSLGATPYPEFTYGSEFTLYIKHGYRLPAPSSATTECYTLMLNCWYDAPEKRPLFKKLAENLKVMIPTKNSPLPQTFKIVKSLQKTHL